MGFSMHGAKVSNEYFKPPEPTQEQRRLSDMQQQMQRAEQEARQQLQRQAEETAREQRRQQEQIQRDSARQMEEQRKQAESQAREQARIAETFRKQAEDVQRQVERQAGEQRRQAEELSRRAEQVRQEAEARAAEVRRRSEEDSRRADLARQEAERGNSEENRRRAEEATRHANELRRQAEEATRQAETARREADRQSAESRRQVAESERTAQEARERANQAAEVERQRREYADQQRRQSSSTSVSEGGVRGFVGDIRRKAEEGAKSFWKTGKSGDDRTDDKKYGFALPRFSTVAKAVGDYTSAEVFDPKQTLFRYDPQTLNNMARQKFYENPAHVGKEFIPPHDTSKPVYEGLPDRKGVVGKLARAWFKEGDSNRGEVGNYLFDIRNYKDKFGQDIQQKLDAGQGVAVRAWVAMPGQPPNTISNVDIAGWNLGDEMFLVDSVTGKVEFSRLVSISRTVGGGEQVISRVDKFLRFFRREFK